MERLNLTLDEPTLRALSEHAKKHGMGRATLARDLIREALASRDATARRRKLAADYSAGRADAVALLEDLEGVQLDLLGAMDD